MGQIIRDVVILLLILGYWPVYFAGRDEGEAIRSKLALAEATANVETIKRQALELVEAERRIQAVQESAASAGSEVRTVIRTEKTLRAVPVPPDIRERLRWQMARTRGYEPGQGGGSDGDARGSN